MRALQEYGRLIKTIHILRWYSDQANRRRLNRQLNKGKHYTAYVQNCALPIKEKSRQQDEQLRNQVGCLNLVTNAVIVWNTVYINQVCAKP